jgi:hypothetical protein
VPSGRQQCFDRRCFGFWNGSNVFRVRVLATQPGKWSWRSDSNQKDTGLNELQGSFNAIAWSEAEKAAVPTRRGFIKPTANVWGWITVPDFPAENDWGLKLRL